MAIIPSKFFLTKGVGTHEKELRAFENALRDAGVHTCNLVRISSIIPPGCTRISKDEGCSLLKAGQIAFAVVAQAQTNEPGQLISAAIGMANPKDGKQHGYLTEVESATGVSADDAAQDAEEMALENLITEWGDPSFDAETIWQKGKKDYSVQGRDIEVDHIVETATGAKGNLYTVVVTIAVMIYEN